jgi:hypothetical protein
MTVGKVDMMSPYDLEALMKKMNDSNTPKGTPEYAEDFALIELTDGVIRGSNLDAFPDYDDIKTTPISVLPRSKPPTVLNDSLQLSEFESVYQELLVCMALTDEELLHYTPTDRIELRLMIDLFLANRGQDYEELAGEIENRALFKDFFPAD